MGVCCTGKQRATYPSRCFGTPSIVSPWPRLTLNCCPKELLQNITKSKASKLLDAIWSPFVVWNNNQALYVMDSSRKLCRVYETPRLSTTSVAWSVLSKRFRRVATVEKEFELKASVIYLLSIQFKYILRRGLKTLQAMLILHSSTEPGSNLTGNANAWREIGYLWGDFVVKFDTHTHSVVIHFRTKHLIFCLTLSASNFKLVGHNCLFEIFWAQNWTPPGVKKSFAGAQTTTEIKCL